MSVPQPRIFAVVVLYGMAPADSPALASLAAFDAPAGVTLAGLIWDNSAESQALPGHLSGWRTVHDSSNPGLALPYQVALDQALGQGFDWLLLLDQDTRVTRQYLEEAIAAIGRLAADEAVVAIVPRLVEAGTTLSPHLPKWHRGRPLDDAPGIYDQAVKVFNSGSLLRVCALVAAGGVPQEFPLDYLDHAIYHRLQQRGGRVYQLAAELEHQLGSRHSDLVTDFAGSARLQSIVAAESRFYRSFGSAREQFRHSLSRLRLAARMARTGQPKAALHLLRLTFLPSPSARGR